MSDALTPPVLRSHAPAEATFRPDWMPIDAYISPDYRDLEDERLWPRTWQIACRLEEIPHVGDYVTYDIVEESIIVLRTAPDTIKAFYNVCPHRARRLLDGCGTTGRTIFCRFHGWKWNIDGTLKQVTDREDWKGSPDFTDAALALREVKVGTWGGWVWICMDPSVEPLQSYLDPVPDVLKNFEIDQLRFAWFKTLIVPCNWKVMVDAFNEGYHTEATHPQVGARSALGTLSVAHGRHTMFWFPAPEKAKARAAAAPPGLDLRSAIRDALIDTRTTLKALVSDHKVHAARRLVEECPASATAAELVAALNRFHREELERTGATWPSKLTDADIYRAGTDWHIFPNTICLPSIDNFLWYRARPNGRDVDSCIFEAWSLERFAPGKEPPIQRDFYPDIESFKGQNPFLEQDFGNVAAVQKGMKSRGFKGARTNPVQEVPINHFHKMLYRYLATSLDQPAPSAVA